MDDMYLVNVTNVIQYNVTESAKTGLICTKHTYLFYLPSYLFSVWVIQYLLVLLNSLGNLVYMMKFLLKYYVRKKSY